MLVSPNPGEFVTQVAIALHEASALHSFVTGLAIHEEGQVAKLLQATIGDRIRNRVVRGLPRARLETRCTAHVPIPRRLPSATRHLLQSKQERWSEYAMMKALRKALDGPKPPNAVYAYENVALRSFEEAKSRGIACILDLPSLDNREVMQLHLDIFDKYPELKSPSWRRRIRDFHCRQEARDRERQLADIIVTNSTVTTQSHHSAGVPAKKMITIPLACPAPLAAALSDTTTLGLKEGCTLVFAGTLSLQKGAKQLADAINSAGPGLDITVDHFGSVDMPAHFLALNKHWLRPQGRLSREKLQHRLAQYRALIFPTLSDGFGLVVGEALAAGTPVFCSSHAGARDLIHEGVNGFVFDPTSLGDFRRILKIAQEGETLGEMRNACLQEAAKRQWPSYRRHLSDTLLKRLSELSFE